MRPVVQGMTWYERNREYALNKAKEYYHTHRQQYRDYQRNYYQTVLRDRRRAGRPANLTPAPAPPTITTSENKIVSFD